jgi:transposase
MRKRNKKYDLDLKKSIVERVIKGEFSCNEAAIKFSIASSMVKRWVCFYSLYGIAGLQPERNKYSASFKLEVIGQMQKKGLSLTATCLQFKIPSVSTLMKWVAIYKREGSFALSIEKRGKRKAMPRKPKKSLSKEEQLLEEIVDLKAENAYLKKLHALVQSEKEKEEKRRSSKN